MFEQFKPEHYELNLSVDREKMTFSGHVTIDGNKVGRPAKRLTFHQNGLKIITAEIIKHDKKGDEEILLSRVNTHQSYNEVRLHTEKILYPGRYSVKLEFSGKITRQMDGIYPCFFKVDGEEKMLIATQFESHHARKAFPCIDEPEAKAVFELSLNTPKDESVISNTPMKSKTIKGQLQTTTFEPTPRMSTYLLAFVFGEMHFEEAKTKKGIIVRTWSTIAQPKEDLIYATSEAANILDFLEGYFGIDYPLAKLDQVALPDFDAGAMENWGLITFREVLLLADPKNRSISSEQLISLVISHELSHQWFGNLVTMKWWDDLWLNESFAGLMEHLGPSVLHPEWQQWEHYTIGDIPLITSRDIYSDIQSVGGTKVVDPDLIETLFDPAILYAKGARLLKMLREYIGDEDFVKGLHKYFKAHAFGNATREDLWKALSEASGKDLQSLMLPWLTQPGMPVIHVDQEAENIKLTQERFLLDAPSDKTIWPIPLLADQKIEPAILDTKSVEITSGSKKPVLLNQFASGQFITHYVNPEQREYIAKQIQTTSLPTEARINLLNDMYMLARHGDAPLSDALDVISKCNHEPRDSVWGMVLRIVGAASQLTEGDKATEELIKKFKIKIAFELYNKLGWDDSENDDPNTKQLRHTMLAVMASGEDKAVIEEGLHRYVSVKALDDLPAETRGTILSIAMRHGDKAVVDRLLKEYESSGPDLQADISGALASTKSPEVARHIVSKALGENGFVRQQDVMRWIVMFLRNYHTRMVAWEFLNKEWSWMEATLSSGKSFDYLPTYCAGVVTTKEWAERYKKFFIPKKKIKILEKNINLGIADVDARVAWRDRDEAGLVDWFKQNA